MNGRRRPARGSFVWRAAIAPAVGIALYIVGCAVVCALGCAAGCARDVPLGVDPRSDAAANDGGIDAGAAD